MATPYFLSDGGNLLLDGTPIIGMFFRSPERNAELRKFSRFMANATYNYGSIHQFALESPLELLNQKRIQSVVYEGMQISLPDIDSLKKEAYVVYDDSLLEHEQVVDILKVKAGLSHNFLDYQIKFNLVTMMLPSYIFSLSSRNSVHAVDMTKLKIFNYTYLNFNHFSRSLNDSIGQNVKSMIRLNLLTVCYETLRQKKPLPFIINPPGAFIRRLSSEQKQAVAQIISDSVYEIWGDTQIHGIVEGAISEWILLNPDFWRLETIIPHNIHFVQADVCHIAEELWKKRGILSPIPMMGAAIGAIGNAALGNHAERALDEFLFRACGGIHGLVGSLRYNPDICILPLSQIIAEMGRSPSI